MCFSGRESGSLKTQKGPRLREWLESVTSSVWVSLPLKGTVGSQVPTQDQHSVWSECECPPHRQVVSQSCPQCLYGTWPLGVRDMLWDKPITWRTVLRKGAVLLARRRPPDLEGLLCSRHREITSGYFRFPPPHHHMSSVVDELDICIKFSSLGEQTKKKPPETHGSFEISWVIHFGFHGGVDSQRAHWEVYPPFILGETCTRVPPLSPFSVLTQMPWN